MSPYRGSTLSRSISPYKGGEKKLTYFASTVKYFLVSAGSPFPFKRKEFTQSSRDWKVLLKCIGDLIVQSI